MAINHKRKEAAIGVFFSSAAILLIIGICMIVSASAVIGMENYNNPFYLIKKHGLYLGIGFILSLIILKQTMSRVKKSIPVFYVFCLILCCLPFVPGIGLKVGGAHRWIEIFGHSFQPVECLKLALCLLWANFLSHKGEAIKTVKEGLLPMGLLSVPALILLALQPDFGNTMLIVCVWLLLMLVSRSNVFHVFLLGLFLLSGAVISVLSNPYQMARIEAFLDPWADPLGKSYHIIQSLTAIGSGGVFGLGLGASKLKFSYLPLFHSDFIFSVLAEEGGLLLASFCILCFLAFVLSGLVIAYEKESDFPRFLVLSLVLFLGMQAYFNMGVTLGLFPITGIPLTFISYGGSSLVFSCVALSLVALSLKKEPVDKES